MKTLMMMLALTMIGCASVHTPSRYNQRVTVTGGLHKGKVGTLVTDCSGIELYKVRFDDGGSDCIRIWNLEEYL